MTKGSLVGLGWKKPTPDPGHDNYLIPRRRREAAPVTRRLWRSPGILDQGNTSECVIYCADKFLTTGPIVKKGFITAAERTRVYKEVQRIDEWPGENYDGTSVHAIAKYLKAKGEIGEYRWAKDGETAINHILTTGPMMLGTLWPGTRDMNVTDKWGYIGFAELPDTDEGHAWCAVGADREKVHPLTRETGIVRVCQSWGRNWGDNGRFSISFHDFDVLIKRGGEACVGVDLRLAA